MNRRILKLAIPNIVSNLSVPLLSSVDTAVVGHLHDVSYLGAIAVGSMIFNFLYWGFGFLRMGTTGLTAQAFGKDDETECLNILVRASIVSIVSALLLLLLQGVIAWAGFMIVHASADVERYARSYFYIRIWAAPATLLMYAVQGWFLGMQNARYPMTVTVVVNLLNVALDLVFVFHFGLQSDGVAYGTLAAAYVGLILSIILVFYRYRNLLKKFVAKAIWEIQAIRDFFHVNKDIFIRTLCLIFTYSFFTVMSASYGEKLLAANTILLQLWNIVSYGVDGFAFAAESLVGRYMGARDEDGLRISIRYILIWGIGLGLVFCLVYAILGRTLIRIYTDQEVLVDLAMSYFAWTAIAPLINSLCFLWDGIFIGATATKAMRNSMIIATFLVFVPVYYLLFHWLGYHTIWLAMTLYMAARGITLTFYAPRRVYAKVRD